MPTHTITEKYRGDLSHHLFLGRHEIFHRYTSQGDSKEI